jgi:hypothetical protein
MIVDRIVAWIDRLATSRNILLYLALYLALNAAVLPLAQARIEAASGGIGPLDSQFTYSPTRAYAALAAYGNDGRQFYGIVEVTAGLVYPAIYGLFFALTIAYCFRRVMPPGHFAHRLALLPLVAALLDYVENALIVVLIMAYPERLAGLAVAAGLITALKSILFAATVLVVMIAIVAVIVVTVRARRAGNQ